MQTINDQSWWAIYPPGQIQTIIDPPACVREDYSGKTFYSSWGSVHNKEPNSLSSLPLEGHKTTSLRDCCCAAVSYYKHGKWLVHYENINPLPQTTDVCMHK